MSKLPSDDAPDFDTVQELNESSTPPANENLAAKIFAPKFCTKRRESKIRAMIRARLYSDDTCFLVDIITDKDGAFAGYTIIKREADNTRQAGNTLRTLCDDCQQSPQSP